MFMYKGVEKWFPCPMIQACILIAYTSNIMQALSSWWKEQLNIQETHKHGWLTS